MNSLAKFNTDWDDSGDEEDKEETEKTVEEKKRLFSKVQLQLKMLHSSLPNTSFVHK